MLLSPPYIVLAPSCATSTILQRLISKIIVLNVYFNTEFIINAEKSVYRVYSKYITINPSRLPTYPKAFTNNSFVAAHALVALRRGFLVTRSEQMKKTCSE